MKLRVKSTYYVMANSNNDDVVVDMSKTMLIARRAFCERKSISRLTRERGRSFYGGHMDECVEKIISGKWIRYETAQ